MICITPMQKYTNHKTEVSPCSQPRGSVGLCSDVLRSCLVFRALW